MDDSGLMTKGACYLRLGSTNLTLCSSYLHVVCPMIACTVTGNLVVRSQMSSFFSIITGVCALAPSLLLSLPMVLQLTTKRHIQQITRCSLLHGVPRLYVFSQSNSFRSGFASRSRVCNWYVGANSR